MKKYKILLALALLASIHNQAFAQQSFELLYFCDENMSPLLTDNIEQESMVVYEEGALSLPHALLVSEYTYGPNEIENAPSILKIRYGRRFLPAYLWNENGKFHITAKPMITVSIPTVDSESWIFFRVFIINSTGGTGTDIDDMLDKLQPNDASKLTQQINLVRAALSNTYGLRWARLGVDNDSLSETSLKKAIRSYIDLIDELMDSQP